ncbi:MAG: DUF1810 family protein [Gemmatimonadaceae bacterium]
MYDRALTEIRLERERSQWMWFVAPQWSMAVSSAGSSTTSYRPSAKRARCTC